MTDLVYEALDALKACAKPEQFEVVKRLSDEIDKRSQLATPSDYVLDMNKALKSRGERLDLELKRKKQQLIVANLETEAALKREFDLDQKLRSLSLAVSSASFVKRLRYAFTGRF